MSLPAGARYEWRCFWVASETAAPSLSELLGQLGRAERAPAGLETRVDTYWLAPGLSPEKNLKLRDGARLELKLRVGTRGPLAAWQKTTSLALVHGSRGRRR